MRIEDFLGFETLDQSLKLNQSKNRGIARIAEVALNVGAKVEKLSLHRLFEPYQVQEFEDPLEELSKKLTEDTIPFLEASLLRGGCTPERISLSKIRAKALRKSNEVVAIGLNSGALQDSEDIVVHDACSGIGRLGLGIMRLRSPKTRLNCHTINERDKSGHDLLVDMMGVSGQFINFLIQDVADSDFRRDPSLNTYVLAKHACGSASDSIISSLVKIEKKEEFPKNSLIMTCCHGKGKKHLPRNISLSTGISEHEWEQLCYASTWNCFTQEDIRKEIGRVAMRLVDILRLSTLPDFLNGVVRELLPSEICVKNHGIIIQKSS